MAITTYGELKTAVGNWLARSDLTSRIPEFVALAEADMKRKLRREVVRENQTVSANPHPISGSLGELRAVRFNTSSYTHSLNIVSVASLAALRRTGSGRPYYAAVVNSDLLFDVTPDTSYVMEFVYFQSLTTLIGADGTTNTTLTRSPDIYLYGTLLHSAPFLEHDARLSVWQSLYEKAILDENIARESWEMGAAPLMIGLPIVFG